MNRNTVMKGTGVLMLVVGIIWLNQTFLQWTPQDVKMWILSMGWYAPIIYFVVYTLRALLLFPASILSLAGGLAFGPIWGTVLTVISATSSASLSFFIARSFGKHFFVVQSTEKVESIQRQLERRGLTYILLVRLIPLIPFDLISYAAGISRIRFRSFVMGTFFGIIPGTFAYTLFGSSFASGNWKDWLLASLVLVLVVFLPLRFRNWLEGGEK